MNHLETLEQTRTYLANILGTSHDYVIAVDRSIAIYNADSESPDEDFGNDLNWSAALILGEMFVSDNFADGDGNIPRGSITEAKEEAYQFYVNMINKSNYWIRDALENTGILYEGIEGVKTYMWSHTTLLVKTAMGNLTK